MEYKILELKRMLTFLSVKRDNHMFIRGSVNASNAYITCDGEANFYSNVFASRSPLTNPTEVVVDMTFNLLSKQCFDKINMESLKHKFPKLKPLLFKFHNLEFLLNG